MCSNVSTTYCNLQERYPMLLNHWFYDTEEITFYRVNVPTVISYYKVFLEPTPLKKFIAIGVKIAVKR